MSVRHLDLLNEMVQGSDSLIPVREVLALPDTLQPCEGYDPCAFGTPGGAPRLLGTLFPVVVDGPYTYVYVVVSGTSTYLKLE